jgi:hypothetical protein
VGGRLVLLPPAAFVRIVPDESAYLLLRFDEDANGITDTWHETLDHAKRQALREYAIESTDWIDETN